MRNIDFSKSFRKVEYKIIMEKALIEKLAKKNILVIDDDGLITRTLCSLLKFQRGQTPTGKIRLINIIT